MANKHILSVEPRKIVGRKVKTLRKQGLVPANIFGKGVTSVSIQVPAKEFAKAYAEVGESTLLYLKVTGSTDEHPVLVRDVTRHAVTGIMLHIDFNQVSLKEKVTAPVAIKLVGESPAEQEKLGILVQQLDEVELEALPTDMPEHIEVSVAELKAVDDAVKAGDLSLEKNKVTLKTDPEAIVVKIEALAKEEVVEPPAAETAETPVAEGDAATEPAAEEKTE